MDPIIEKLYNLHINEQSFAHSISPENINEEMKTYDLLYTQLSTEQKKLFLKYINLHGIRECEESKNIYERGFKTAVQLFVESLKD